MHRARSSLCWSASVLIAVGIAGCKSTFKDDEAPGRPTSSRIAFAEQWSAAIHDMGMFPVFPPTEDVYVGDVFAFSAPPSLESARSADGLRTAATPRWKSLQVLSSLEEEYRTRPTWNRSGEVSAPATPGDETWSLYRSDRVPVRHRVVGLRSMLKVTLTVADLEPFIPIEIAPLIEGPATQDRYAASVQAGDSETYSLSVDTLIEHLLDVVEGPDGPKFVLKPEHLVNLSLAADPKTGKAYLVAVTQVLYVRSIEATLRKRERAPAPEATDAEQAPAEQAPAEGQVDPVEPVPEAPDAEDPATAAIHRARAMNEAFGESGIEDQSGEAVQMVMVTNDAITLRRSWPYPLAVAIRGITVEIDVSTGDVLRMGPLGIELPKLPPPPKPPEPEPEPEASETEPSEGP